MGMGALIHIEEERTLTFDSGTYAAPEPGCSCSWMGVEIEQNASFDMDASTIGNAVYGINLLNDNSSIDKEPSLTMNNSTLLGNYVGILAKDGPFLLEFTGNSIIGGELEICDCLQGDIIAGIGPVGPTYDPNTGTCPDGFGGNGMDNSFVNYSYAGIWVDDNFDKGIYLNIPGGNPNTFLNLPLGINVLSADADIIGCDFINIGEFGYDNNDQNFSFECQQVDLEAMPPEDVGDPIELEILEVAWGDGIRFDDKAGSHTLTVPTDNSFFNCVRGIYVTSEDGLTRANIFETDMLLVEKGINIVGSTSGGNVKFAQIQDNNIIANKSGSGGFGIEINDGDLNSSSFTILNNKVIVSHPVFANGINVLGWSPIDLVHEARIRRNNVTIIDGDFGINVSNIATSFVEENRIDIEDTNGGQAGINIEQGTKRHIGSCNTINNNNKSNDYIGLHVTGTEGSYNNNMTSNFSEGIKFDQDCNNSDVEKNIFKGEMGTGLSYGADAVTGEQENTGNHWSFNFSGLGANHAGGPLGNFEDSRYLAHDSQIPTFFPPNFFLEAGNVVDTGACAISNDPPSSFLTSSLSNLLVTNANHSFSEGSYFEMQRNLYENLVEYPDGMNESSDYQDFFDLHNEGIIGELYTIQSEFSALYSLDENTQFLFDNYESSLDDNLSQLRQIQNALYDQPENESLKQQWRNLIASNSVIHANYKNILSGLKSDRITNAAVIWDLNEQLVSTNLPSLNEKQLNKIYLEVIIMEERALSDSDRFIIEQIANQCYEQGGRAVFQARNWHYTISGNWLSNITCELEARIGTTSKNFRNEITEMNIVPNPNSGKMNIGFDPIKSDQVSLKITDVFGKELRNLHLSIGQSFAKINISEVSSGVYYAFLINDKKIVSTQKFIKE